ncbi:MAG: hypothetical protein IJ297_07240 [Clostridia bacterium]|nr:hypothetical protein [Clostridia bacterium]
MIGIEQLREHLSDLGFESEENEEEMLLRCIERAEQTIMNYCNCESVPIELIFTALDMAAGEYLLAARCPEDDVKSVSEGDVSVSFSDEGTGERVDEIFARAREEMTSFRRLKW